jgi:rhodanese-related sulfurtransferase/predicted peroxiredoxin
MCSKSNVNDALQGVAAAAGGGGGGGVIIPTVSAHRVRQNREAYFLVDVREASEIAEQPFASDAQVTLGLVCKTGGADQVMTKVAGTDKTVVTVCNTGGRAEIAARHILQTASSSSGKVAMIQNGLVGWDNMAAAIPDFLVVLGLGDNTEKLSLALAACANGSEVHSTVMLALMSDGVNWFVKDDKKKAGMTNVETVAHGEPFKPCKAMLNKFLGNGGIIVACTSCVKHRGLSLETDMMDCVHSLQMPDMIRMMGEAKGGCLQLV